jgi:hypothetical protein
MQSTCVLLIVLEKYSRDQRDRLIRKGGVVDGLDQEEIARALGGVTTKTVRNVTKPLLDKRLLTTVQRRREAMRYILCPDFAEILDAMAPGEPDFEEVTKTVNGPLFSEPVPIKTGKKLPVLNQSQAAKATGTYDSLAREGASWTEVGWPEDEPHETVRPETEFRSRAQDRKNSSAKTGKIFPPHKESCTETLIDTKTSVNASSVPFPGPDATMLSQCHICALQKPCTPLPGGGRLLVCESCRGELGVPPSEQQVPVLPRTNPIASVRKFLLARTCMRPKWSQADAQDAAAFLRAGFTLTDIEHAIALGCLRKLCQAMNVGFLEPINSLRYFRGVLDEIREEPMTSMGPATLEFYWRRTHQLLERYEQQWLAKGAAS